MSVGNGTYTLTTGSVPLFANFSANKTKGFASLTIQFNDSSKNATSVNWNFGDGNNSTERNPIHKFATQGNYTVNLTAANENGTDSKLATINVYEHLVFPGCTNPPTDPDQDDHYEDINGNGILDFDDIVVLYHNVWWIKEKARVAFFDFNSNTLIDFNDVIKLYDMKKQKI
jgi:PKD repeat protein